MIRQENILDFVLKWTQQRKEEDLDLLFLTHIIPSLPQEKQTVIAETLLEGQWNLFPEEVRKNVIQKFITSKPALLTKLLQSVLCDPQDSDCSLKLFSILSCLDINQLGGYISDLIKKDASPEFTLTLYSSPLFEYWTLDLFEEFFKVADQLYMTSSSVERLSHYYPT